MASGAWPVASETSPDRVRPPGPTTSTCRRYSVWGRRPRTGSVSLPEPIAWKGVESGGSPVARKWTRAESPPSARSTASSESAVFEFAAALTDAIVGGPGGESGSPPQAASSSAAAAARSARLAMEVCGHGASGARGESQQAGGGVPQARREPQDDGAAASRLDDVAGTAIGHDGERAGEVRLGDRA